MGPNVVIVDVLMELPGVFTLIYFRSNFSPPYMLPWSDFSYQL